METVAACLLGLTTAGYLALAGAGLGLGMLLRFLGRTPAERRRVLGCTAARQRAHDVWLLAAAAFLTCGFPSLAAGLVAGLWPPLALLTAGTLARYAGYRARAVDAVLAGNWAAATGWAWLLASFLSRDPLRPGTGAAAALTAVAVLLLFVTHGTAYAALRLTGEPFQRARQFAGRQAGRRSLPLSAAVLAALPPLSGARLPLAEHAAAAPVLGVLIPLVPAVSWWLWRRALRGTGGARWPDGDRSGPLNDYR